MAGVVAGAAVTAWLLGGAAAEAFMLYDGDVFRANLDTTLTYGAQWRVQGRDPALIGTGNGGDAPNVNWDDGNLNYGKGLVSNLFRVTSELDAGADWGGVFVRGTAFYDFENMKGDRERYSLGDNAVDQVGKGADLLDAYAWLSYDTGPLPMQVRVGEQVVNWGESTFIAGGIGLNTVNPLDISKLRTPGAELREALLPEGMLWGSVGLSENLSVEALYLYDWEETHFDEPGTYFSIADILGDDGFKVMAADVPDNGDASAAATFMAAPRGGDEEPRDQGQFGVALRYYAPALNNTEFGFYYMRYHSKMPTLSVRTGTLAGVTTAAAVGGAAAPISSAVSTYLAANPGDESGAIAAGTAAGTAAGAPTAASQAIAATATAGGDVAGVTQAYATDAYVKTMRYRAEYEEDLQLFGLGFNTELFGWGFQGEVSYRPDTPLQIDDTELFFAALANIDPSGAFASLNQVGDYSGQYATWLPESIKRDTVQVQMTFSKLFGAILGAEGSAFLAEVGWLHVRDMPDQSDVRFETFGPYGTGNAALGPAVGVPVESSDLFPDANSWGYVLFGQLDYKNVIGPIGLSPRLAWSHDVQGISPNGGPFVAGRKALTVGVEGLYLEDWSADLSYTTYFGAGKLNLVNDRDFVGMNVKYRF